MKKILLTLLVALLLPSIAIAQQRSESNEVRTRVGNPIIQATSCPIPNGIPSCGSKNYPAATTGCAHGSASYCSAHMCYESIAYAMDIEAPEGADVYLPTIEGNAIKWAFMDQAQKDTRTSIQIYGGTDEKTGQQYLIRFHHSLPNSGGGVKYSGEVGAKTCIEPCENGTGPHTHIEFARINNDGSYTWLDAPLYFCTG